MRNQMIKWVAGATIVLTGAVGAQAESPDRVAELEKRLDAMSAELATLKTQQTENTSVFDDLLNEDSKFSFGGYGDVHFNYSQGTDGKDLADLHRLVLYTGYEFNDWIKFNAETEIEHATTDEGYVAMEQAYVDFLLNPKFNLSVGRVLVPVGIINQTHEPTTFNGVERPNVEKYIIPSTWFGDGIGAYGQLNDHLSYQAYVLGGLDGSGFSDSSGIRGGRLKGRPSLNNPALTGRLDYYALQNEDQDLRIGISGYGGGVDNGNKGEDSDAGGEILMVSADFEYRIKNVDLRGVIAQTHFTGAEELYDITADDPTDTIIGTQMLGWYLEAAVHILPDAAKKGKLEQADLVLFSRYEYYNTQEDTESGYTADGNNERTDITFGANFYLTPQFVVKADYQIKMDEAGKDPANALNLGLGWNF
jgi:phosphate-selective porin